MEGLAAASGPELNRSLHLGATGLAWAAAHLQVEPGTKEWAETSRRIDENLRRHLETVAGWENYDLICGLAGIGVYALERLPDPMAEALLSRAVARLDGLAERQPDGVTWRTVPDLLPPRHRKATTDYFDLGVAHGVTGVIGLLARVCSVGVADDRTRPLLDGAVAWLLAQRRPDESGTHFRAWITSSGARRAVPPAWCYGDLGIAAVLLMAARCADRPAWAAEALALARAVAERPPETSDVLDAQLCHGAAGIGHLFNRMYQATHEAWLAEAAVSWFDYALALRRPGQKIAGFNAARVARDGRAQRVARRGFLHGAAGIGLALLAATTAIEPAWDRVLLLS